MDGCVAVWLVVLTAMIQAGTAQSQTLRLGFSEEHYSGNEGPDRRSALPNMPCTVTIRLQGTTIETPLTFRIVPQTIAENLAANGPPPTATLRGANASRMDFDMQPLEVTMAAGTEVVMADIPIVDDEINEAEEEFVVVLELVSSITNPVEFTTQTTVCRIPQSDPIELGFRQARVEHNESQATFWAILEKDRQSEQIFDIRIQISTPRIQGVGEPATAFPTQPADFRLGSTNFISVRLTPADNDTVLAYQIFEDNIPENTEVFQLSSDPDPTVPNNPEFNCDADPMFRFNGRDCFPDLQVLILDNDVVVIGYVETLVEVDESDGQATLTVNISVPAPDSILRFWIMFRLDATMMNITAGPRPASFGRFDPFTPGLHDYQEIAPGSVLPRDFEDNRRSQTFSVVIYEDDVPEGVEELNITLSLQDPSLANRVTVTTPAVATVRIRDNDNVLMEFDPTAYTVSESEGAVVMFRIVNRTMTTQTFSVQFTTSPGTATATNDFIGRTGVTVTFAPDQIAIVNITVVNDDILENTEQFTAVLTIPGSTLMIGAATVTITDDDSVVIQFDPVTYTAAEGDLTMLRIVRVGNADIPVSANVSTLVGTAELADFAAITNRVVTFQPGDTEQFVLFTSSADTVVEDTEMLTAVLSNPSAGATLGQDTANISLLDVEVVVVEFDPTMYTVTESDGVVVMFRITRTNTTQPVSVLFSTSPGTALDPVDFTGQTNTTVTFASSETEQNVSVSVVNDNTLESTETFTAMLAAIPGSIVKIGAGGTATATITDDDIMTPPPESTTAPPESNIVVPIAGAVAALGSVTIISFSIIITAIIVTRSRQARFELHKEETQGATASSAYVGASEVKFKEEIPMAECMAYGTRGDYSVSCTFRGGVIEGQQGMEGENEGYEEVYEPIPN